MPEGAPWGEEGGECFAPSLSKQGRSLIHSSTNYVCRTHAAWAPRRVAHALRTCCVWGARALRARCARTAHAPSNDSDTVLLIINGSK